MASQLFYTEGTFSLLHHGILRDSIIGVKGFPGRTNNGELTIRAALITPLGFP